MVLTDVVTTSVSLIEGVGAACQLTDSNSRDSEETMFERRRHCRLSPVTIDTNAGDSTVATMIIALDEEADIRLVSHFHSRVRVCVDAECIK